MLEKADIRSIKVSDSNLSKPKLQTSESTNESNKSTLSQLTESRSKLRGNTTTQNTNSIAQELSNLNGSLRKSEANVASSQQNVDSSESNLNSQTNITSDAKIKSDQKFNEFKNESAKGNDDASKKSLEDFNYLKEKYNVESVKLGDNKNEHSESVETLNQDQLKLEKNSEEVNQKENKLNQTSSILSESTKAGFLKADEPQAARAPAAARGRGGRGNNAGGGNGIPDLTQSINNFLNEVGGVAQNAVGQAFASGGPGAAFLTTARILNTAASALLGRAISTNAFVNIAANLTARTMAQQSVSVAQAGVATETNSATNLSQSLRSELARGNAVAGMTQEALSTWRDIGKQNFVKGVAEGNENAKV